MIYGSVCSGIEAATVAWHPLGWKPAFFSEIEAFPCAVLQHHYAGVPLHGDFTTIGADDYGAIDLLVGGTPCQDFSIAGLRAGLDGDRGNLTLEFLRLADRKRPKWLVWENVPGVFSANEGRAFGAIVGALGQLGYGWAYRVLDAQYFGVPQRRRRVFVVGCFGNPNAAAAVLFERACMSGHPTPRRETRKDIAGTLGARASAGGGLGTDFELDGGQTAVYAPESAHALSAQAQVRWDESMDTLIAHSLRADGFDASEDGTGRGTPIVPATAPCLTRNYGKQPDSSDTALSVSSESFPPITARHGDPGVTPKFAKEMTPTLAIPSPSGGGQPMAVATQSAVRRLTPIECERLQGFPDNYTLVPYRKKPAADGPRYRALGNSMAVPVMRWIGERIEQCDQILRANVA